MPGIARTTLGAYRGRQSGFSNVHVLNDCNKNTGLGTSSNPEYVGTSNGGTQATLAGTTSNQGKVWTALTTSGLTPVRTSDNVGPFIGGDCTYLDDNRLDIGAPDAFPPVLLGGNIPHWPLTVTGTFSSTPGSSIQIGLCTVFPGPYGGGSNKYEGVFLVCATQDDGFGNYAAQLITLDNESGGLLVVYDGTIVGAPTTFVLDFLTNTYSINGTAIDHSGVPSSSHRVGGGGVANGTLALLAGNRVGVILPHDNSGSLDSLTFDVSPPPHFATSNHESKITGIVETPLGPDVMTDDTVDVNGTLLEHHTPTFQADPFASWQQDYESGLAMEIKSNRICGSLTAGTNVPANAPNSRYFFSDRFGSLVLPMTATGTLHVVSFGTDPTTGGVAVWNPWGADDCYLGRHYHDGGGGIDRWEIVYVTVDFGTDTITNTVLASFNAVLTVGNDYVIKLVCTDGSQELFIDGISVCSSADTNINGFTSNLAYGVIFDNSTPTGGYHITTAVQTDPSIIDFLGPISHFWGTLRYAGLIEVSEPLLLEYTDDAFGTWTAVSGATYPTLLDQPAGQANVDFDIPFTGPINAQFWRLSFSVYEDIAGTGPTTPAGNAATMFMELVTPPSTIVIEDFFTAPDGTSLSSHTPNVQPSHQGWVQWTSDNLVINSDAAAQVAGTSLCNYYPSVYGAGIDSWATGGIDLNIEYEVTLHFTIPMSITGHHEVGLIYANGVQNNGISAKGGRIMWRSDTATWYLDDADHYYSGLDVGEGWLFTDRTWYDNAITITNIASQAQSLAAGSHTAVVQVRATGITLIVDGSTVMTNAGSYLPFGLIAPNGTNTTGLWSYDAPDIINETHSDSFSGSGSLDAHTNAQGESWQTPTNATLASGVTVTAADPNSPTSASTQLNVANWCQAGTTMEYTFVAPGVADMPAIHEEIFTFGDSSGTSGRYAIAIGFNSGTGLWEWTLYAAGSSFASGTLGSTPSTFSVDMSGGNAVFQIDGSDIFNAAITSHWDLFTTPQQGTTGFFLQTAPSAGTGFGVHADSYDGGGNVILTASVSVAGTGYKVNDVVRLVGGTGTPAVLRIDTVGGAGDVLTFTILDGGNYSSHPFADQYTTQILHGDLSLYRITNQTAATSHGETTSGLQVTYYKVESFCGGIPVPPSSGFHIPSLHYFQLPPKVKSSKKPKPPMQALLKSLPSANSGTTTVYPWTD